MTNRLIGAVGAALLVGGIGSLLDPFPSYTSGIAITFITIGAMALGWVIGAIADKEGYR